MTYSSVSPYRVLIVEGRLLLTSPRMCSVNFVRRYVFRRLWTLSLFVALCVVLVVLVIHVVLVAVFLWLIRVSVGLFSFVAVFFGFSSRWIRFVHDCIVPCLHVEFMVMMCSVHALGIVASVLLVFSPQIRIVLFFLCYCCILLVIGTLPCVLTSLVVMCVFDVMVMAV